MKKDNLEKKSQAKWKKIGIAVIAGCVLLLVGLTWAGVRMVWQNPAKEENTAPALEEASIEHNTGEEEIETEEVSEPEEPETELPESIQMLEELGVPIPEKEIDFEDLQENVNSDIYAWIYIPDSKIDYPILQHPVDNRYYLNYNLDDSYGYPGCIYTERYNRKNFSDPITVVYGHNMKNGTMFAGLHNFEDIEYFTEHPYIYIYTPEKLYVYQIFISHEYGSEHLLYNHDYSREEEMESYIDKISKVKGMNCNRSEGAEVSKDSHILVLSTCMADKPDYRYLVQGVLLNED